MKFGLPIQAGPTTKHDADEKKQQRAIRFGNVSGTVLNAEDDEKRKVRLERFGNAATSGTVNTVNNAEEEERKKKRLERFGNGESSVDQIPGARVVKRINQ